MSSKVYSLRLPGTIAAELEKHLESQGLRAQTLLEALVRKHLASLVEPVGSNETSLEGLREALRLAQQKRSKPAERKAIYTGIDYGTKDETVVLTEDEVVRIEADQPRRPVPPPPPRRS